MDLPPVTNILLDQEGESHRLERSCRREISANKLIAYSTRIGKKLNSINTERLWTKSHKLKNILRPLNKNKYIIPGASFKISGNFEKILGFVRYPHTNDSEIQYPTKQLPRETYGKNGGNNKQAEIFRALEPSGTNKKINRHGE